MSLVASLVTYVTASAPTQLLLWSSLVLVVGLLVRVRRDAIHARFLDNVPLSRVEKEQMHLPSLRVIVGVFLCATALLIVVLGVQTGDERNAYWWLPTVATFVLGASFGTLAELQWKKTREWAFAVTVGSAISFIAFIALVPASSVRLWQLCLLALIGILAWRTFIPSWSRTTQAVALLTFVFWILILTWIVR